MPYKDPIIRAASNKTYNMSWYERNKDRHKATSAKNRLIRKAEWTLFKEGLSCEQCGFSHSAAIDFHHLDPSLKEAEVNQLVGNGRYKAAYKEVEKCIPLCANCHRILHYNRQRGTE